MLSKKLLHLLIKLNLIVWLAAAIGSVYFSIAEASAPEKIIVCHFGVTKEIPARAIEAHLAHGDYLGECVSGESISEVDSIPLYNMWLLTRGNWHCLIRSNTHPSIERQNALCFSELTGGTWFADNAPCMAPVMSNGTWYCDKYTPWRIR